VSHFISFSEKAPGKGGANELPVSTSEVPIVSQALDAGLQINSASEVEQIAKTLD
jgi:hypothetical protein